MQQMNRRRLGVGERVASCRLRARVRSGEAMRRMMRSAAGVVVVVAASQAVAASADAALPSADARAAAPLIVSPGADAVVRRSPVRVVVRVRAGATRTRVRLDRRDVTVRFRAEGGRLVGRLALRNGLRYGHNKLVVVSKRSGEAEVVRARSFFLVRRNDRFVRLALRRSDPRRAQIDIVSGAPLIELRRRERTVRAWLNGRAVTKAIIAPDGARRTLSLSATHGLRFGVNRLRVLVTEPRDGRYALVERRFVVRRDGPLAAAGWDRAGQPGVRVRVGGRAKAARGGRLRYRWALVRRPRGSRARLAARRKARPLLVPDRPGRYVLRQHVSERRRAGASASLVGSSSADDVLVVANPPSGLFTLSANAFPVDPRGIQIGDGVAGNTFYAHPGPGGTIQWLTLDRGTLEPTGSGNTWCCGDGDNSLASLADTLSPPSLDQFVILTIPPDRQTLTPDQFDAFNDVLDTIGVDPISDATFADLNQQITIVGVPGGGKGSGWIMRRSTATVPPPGSNTLPTQGWLMIDGQKTAQQMLRFRFQPERLPFDTSSPHSPTVANTVNIAGQYVSASGPPGDPAFQVVEVDPRDLSIVDNQTYAIGDQFAVQSLDQMAGFINAAREHQNYVAVQSIGSVGPNAATADHWSHVTEALVAMGANPHLFNIGGSGYAFFGGPPLTREEVIQSSSNTVVNPTSSPPTHDTGALTGRLRMRPDGLLAPTLGPSGSPRSSASLYDVILRPATPWPHTAASDPEAPAYAAAMHYLTCNLGAFSDYIPDLRTAYLVNPGLPPDHIADLKGIPYPGDNWTCPPGTPGRTSSEPSFTREQFSDLQQELQTEFEDIADATKFIGIFQDALQYSGDKQGRDVQSIGEAINSSVDPPNDDVVSSVLFLFESIAEVGQLFDVTGEGVSAGVGLLASIYDLGSSIASSNGMPVSQDITATADDLGHEAETNVANAEEALNSILAVAVSDYGRLTAIEDLYKQSTATADDLETHLTAGASRYFVSELSPLEYSPYSMRYENPTAAPPPSSNCNLVSGLYNFPGAPEGAWVPFLRHPVSASFDGWETRIVSDVGVLYYYYLPDSVTTPMFNSPYQGSDNGPGWGVEKTTWFWEQGDAQGDNAATCSGP
jgi:hypothetical protein